MKRLPNFALPKRLKFNEIISRKNWHWVENRANRLTLTERASLLCQRAM